MSNQELAEQLSQHKMAETPQYQNAPYQGNGASSNPIAPFRAMLVKNVSEFQNALPKGFPAMRMIRMALTQFHKNPTLARCTPESFCAAVLQSAQLNLEPGDNLGYAYLVPYGNQVQFQLGYQGMIALALRSGQVMTIMAEAVYEDDEYEVIKGLNPDLIHKPSKKPPSLRGQIIAFYAVAKLKGGGVQFKDMWKEEVDAVMSESQAYKRAEKGKKNSPWHTHYVEMGCKTVLKKLFKWLPKSTTLNAAIYADGRTFTGDELEDGKWEVNTSPHQGFNERPTHPEPELVEPPTLENAA